MSNINHLFTGFSILFDPNTSTKEKARVKASIQDRIENNLDLITRLAQEGKTSQTTTNIIHQKQQ